MTRTALLLLVLLAALAHADTPKRLLVSVEGTGALSLTTARTQGGLGGGVGVAFALAPSWLVEARIAWLWGLGSHTLVHVGGGWQRSEGLWRPAVLAELVLGLGGALDFSVNGQPPTRAPTLGAVLVLQPLRFGHDGVFVNVLGLEGGVSTEFLSVGPRLGVTLFSLSLAL